MNCLHGRNMRRCAECLDELAREVARRRGEGIRSHRCDTSCPHCGYRADMATACGENRDAAPDAGSVSVCLGCAGLAIFTGEGPGLRRCTAEEERTIRRSPHVQRALAAMRAVMARRRAVN